jgi:ACS family hexuronate transporter-like MFS transporter
VWYFVTFWIARYLADVHHWKLKEIGWYAVIPFVMADAGNIIGGYFTQFIIKRGVAIAKARRVSLVLAGFFMVLPLLLGPVVIGSPMSALIVFGLAGFGYTSYTANSLALTADVVPHAAASAWGLACIGNGIGGAIFQSLSGVVLKKVSAVSGYVVAYNVLFLGFGVSVLVGMVVLLLFAGSFGKSRMLYS